MKTRLLFASLAIISLFSITGCDSNKEEIPTPDPINIFINSDENYLMDENATITIPFSVHPADADISNLKIEYKDYIYSSTDILAFRSLGINKIIPTEKTGSYIAHLYITDQTEYDKFIPNKSKRYRIIFSRAYLYLDTNRSNDFNVVFIQGANEETDDEL